MGKLDLNYFSKHFLEKCQTLPKIKVAAVYPCSKHSLNGVIESATAGIIDPILIGPKTTLNALATKLEIDLTPYSIIDAEHAAFAVQTAIRLIHEGRADAIMKGNLHTDELMKEILRKSAGLRTERRVSHAFIIAAENYRKPFIVTDAAINIAPDLLTKKDIIQNAVDLAHILDTDIHPKVAVLSAIETVNPSIPSTIDAACLSKMSERGQITGAIVDGPFAFDSVICLEAAATKKIHSPVVGDVDIFVVPNLEAGNIFAKQLMYLASTFSAGIILGAKVPVILTSRSDGVRSRMASCAIAAILVNAQPSRNHVY